MKYPLFIFLILVFFMEGTAQQTDQKRRVMVLTDIENEPDDAQSMVRFLTYSNQWDVEGLVATTSEHLKNKTAAWRIREIVEAYGKVRGNLALHEPGYPETHDLLKSIKEGHPSYGMQGVGAGKDSEGSEWIIQAVDKADDRPLWILAWGGPNCLAQALWNVRMTRSPSELDRFVSKIRVYAISDQDDSAPWIRATFPNLFYIATPGMNPKGAYHFATWTGISGDRFHGRFQGADFTIVDNPWLDEHIRSHGFLGAEYPVTKYLMEGDSPSFLYLVENGLGDPEHPEYGSWGGRYEYYLPPMKKWMDQPETRPFWTNAIDEVKGVDGNNYTGYQETIWRWREAYQNDFAARMDWTVKPYDQANHPPVAALAHPKELRGKSGVTISLSAEGSTDPDGDQLSFEWIYYREAGSYAGKNPVEIKDKDKKKAFLTVPRVDKPETFHVALSVTDDGKPSLTRYQRIVIIALPGS